MRGEESDQDSTSTDALVGPKDSLSSSTLEAGALILGKYCIVRRLGAGGMGEVYEARHQQLGSRVALKLPLGRRSGARIAARLLREARVGASLEPEHVVRVLDVATLEDGTPLIVLEYLEGESLADVVARGPVSIDTAVAWVRQACIGLAEAHEHGIVHRDVKPSNLFLEQRRSGARVRVLDFGIATIRAATQDEGAVSLTDSHAIVGSPPYMAPEQLRDVGSADARSDVWALGATLFELLTGRRPFSGRGAALVAAILTSEPPSLSKAGCRASPELEALVRRCLSKEPDERPRDAGELDVLLAPFDARTVSARARRRAKSRLSKISLSLWIGFAALAAGGAALALRANPAGPVAEQRDSANPTASTTIHPDDREVGSGAVIAQPASTDQSVADSSEIKPIDAAVPLVARSSEPARSSVSKAAAVTLNHPDRKPEVEPTSKVASAPSAPSAIASPPPAGTTPAPSLLDARKF